MEYHVREATIADLPHIMHHRRAMFTDIGLGDTVSLNQVDEVSKNYFTQAMQQGTYKGWLAEMADHTVIGGGGIVIASWPGVPGESLAQRAWILNMYTEPKARRRGVAKCLVQAMIAWCRERGLSGVSLHASDAGRPVYESLGFLPTNEMRLELR